MEEAVFYKHASVAHRICCELRVERLIAVLLSPPTLACWVVNVSVPGTHILGNHVYEKLLLSISKVEVISSAKVERLTADSIATTISRS
jgi:hypothetical protein